MTPERQREIEIQYGRGDWQTNRAHPEINAHTAETAVIFELLDGMHELRKEVEELLRATIGGDRDT